MANNRRPSFLAYILVAAIMLAGCGPSEDAETAETPAESHSTTAESQEEPESEAGHTGHVAEPVGPFLPVADSDLQDQIDAALNRASELDKRVLLEFLAGWCVDCQEVIRVSEEAPARDVLRDQYEIVYVEVGRFDRHTHLIERYSIRSIATLVVLDPSGSRVAQTTLEPISRHEPLTSDALARWLRNPS